jgi:hypothetical protein
MGLLGGFTRVKGIFDVAKSVGVELDTFFILDGFEVGFGKVIIVGFWEIALKTISNEYMKGRENVP